MYYLQLAAGGTEHDVALILQDLRGDATFAETRFIDYALSLVASAEGVATIEKYLFEGTQMQRNYCALFFIRRSERGDWAQVKKAYQLGLIDKKQAFAK